MKKISIADSPDDGLKVVPKVQEPAQDVQDDADDEVDYSKVLERIEEIDLFTLSYICNLMGFSDDDIDSLKTILDPSALGAIEDDFEEILANYGITIYRPTIITDDDGKERVVDSIYE